MQTPRFGHDEVQDPVRLQEIRLLDDLMVASVGRQCPMLDSEVDAVLGLPAPEPVASSVGECSSALMRAVNSQNRWAPSARAASEQIPSATSVYRTLLEVSRTGGLRTA